MATSDELPESASQVDSAPAQREIGYVVAAPRPGASWWAFDEQREDSPELRWPACVGVYDRMRRQDAKVRSVARAVKSPLTSTTWRLDPGKARDEVVQHVSADVGLPIKGISDKDQVSSTERRRGRFSWSEHMRLALLSLEFGHSVFEQTYVLDASGRLRLRKLGHRASSSIAKWNVARDGGLISVEQYSPGMVAGGRSDVTLPVNRLVVYSHEREGAEWWGQSLLRPAYKHWLVKDRLLRVDAMAIERNGIGIPMYEGAETDDSTVAQADLDAGRALAQAIRAGDNSGGATPYGAKMRLMGVEGELPDALKSVMYHDDQIGTAVLAHFLNLGRQTGSWALGSTFADFFLSSVNGVGNFIADVATAHIVEDLVDLNYGHDEPAPTVVFDDLAGQDQALAFAIKALVDAGVLQPDDALQTYLRTAYKLPQRDDSTPSTGDDQ